MANCRTYKAFDDLTRLSAIDLSDLIAATETVRCLVNFSPPHHAWDLTADTDGALQRADDRAAEGVACLSTK